MRCTLALSLYESSTHFSSFVPFVHLALSSTASPLRPSSNINEDCCRCQVICGRYCPWHPLRLQKQKHSDQSPHSSPAPPCHPLRFATRPVASRFFRPLLVAGLSSTPPSVHPSVRQSPHCSSVRHRADSSHTSASFRTSDNGALELAELSPYLPDHQIQKRPAHADYEKVSNCTAGHL